MWHFWFDPVSPRTNETKKVHLRSLWRPAIWLPKKAYGIESKLTTDAEKCYVYPVLCQFLHSRCLYINLFAVFRRRDSSMDGLPLQYPHRCVSFFLKMLIKRNECRNGSIVAFGAYFHNTYMVGLLKKFFGRESVKPIDDEGDFYFGQLMQQWDEHYDHWLSVLVV